MSQSPVVPSKEAAYRPLLGGDEDMGRRRGRQKGYLRNEGASWIGYWWEEVRLADGKLDWHRAGLIV